MTDRDALLAAILDRPDDDTPRLVLADWLEDQGEAERAAFVRIGIETARTAAHCYHDLTRPPDCPVCALHLRARELACAAVARGGDGGVHAWQAWSNLPGEWACLNLIGDATMERIERSFDNRRATGRDDRPGGNYFRFRRGFVDEVRLPLAAFAGGECENCGGTGRVDGDRYEQSEPCPDCGGEYGPSDEDNPRGVEPGTGRLPGLARELFEKHPITRVVLTDRSPGTGGGWFWTWPNERAAEWPSSLPRNILDRGLQRGGITISYPTRDDAMTALSAACVAYGRELAGLRPLTALPPTATVVGPD